MDDLRGERTLITGAAKGIGRCTAAEFARAGCPLVLTDIDGPALEATAEELRRTGGSVHTRVVDVANAGEVAALAEWVEDELGPLAILINNAGVGYHGELAETSLETWQRLIAINLLGPLHHLQAFIPRMIERRHGRIVNVSSGQAFFQMPTWGAYAAIKAALGVMSEVLHYELRPYGIRVTTVYPFMVNTGFYQGIEGHTWGARLSMKLLPYYSYSPERVGRILFEAVARGKKIEMASLINEFGFYSRLVPLLPDIIARSSSFFLARRD